MGAVLPVAVCTSVPPPARRKPWLLLPVASGMLLVTVFPPAMVKSIMAVLSFWTFDDPPPVQVELLETLMLAPLPVRCSQKFDDPEKSIDAPAELILLRKKSPLPAGTRSRPLLRFNVPIGAAELLPLV